MAYWTKYRKEDVWVVSLEEGEQGTTGDTVTVKKRDGSTQQVTLGEHLVYRLFRATERGAQQDANGQPIQRQGGERQPAAPVTTVGEAATARAALLARLDPDQQKVAVWDGRSNMRIVAAAGSGKTTTVVAMATNLLAAGLPPDRLIITTFTSKAGLELAERLGKVVAANVMTQLKVGTFHGLALRALRTADPQGWAMSRCVDASRGRTAGLPAANTLWIKACESNPIQILNESGVGVGKEVAGDYRLAVEAYCLSRGLRHDSPEGKAAADDVDLPQLHEVWSLYERQKRAHNGFDFSDALFALRDFLRANTASRDCVVVVDEAQDNSALQIELAELLAGRGKVMLVGDVRQSIYGWRGAAPKLFLDADKRIGASTLYLPNNYRSGRSIVALGNRIAEGKDWSLGPPAKASRDTEGTITVTGYGDIGDVAEGVAREVAAKVKDGARPDAFAILCRTRAEQASYEASLLAAQVPVAIVGGSSFFASRMWKDYASVLSCVSGAATAELIGRAVETAPGVGGWTGKDVATAYGRSHDFGSALEDVADKMRHRTRRESLYAFMRFVREAERLDFKEACARVAEHLCAQLAEGTGENDPRAEVMAAATIAARFENMAEVTRFAAKCEGSALALAEDAKDEAAQGRVCISTIHKAKGREWPFVFCDVSANRFPHARAKEGAQNEEEQRLFYVAVTRAADTLKLSHCAVVNEKAAGPSEFLDLVEQPKGPSGGEPKPVKTPPRGPAPVPPTVRRMVKDEEQTHALEVALKHHGDDALLDSMEQDVLGRPTQPLQLVSAEPEPVVTAGESVSSLKAGLMGSMDRAALLTAAGTQPLAGQRFVPVTLAEFEELLSPLGFETDEGQTARSGQYVMTCRLESGCEVSVHTTVPMGDSAARGLGEDSIRFTLLGPTGKPLMKRQPYSARTKNWRSTVVSRLLEVVSRFGQPCAKCNGPTTERQAKEGGRTFHGCIRYPDCNGYAKA